MCAFIDLRVKKKSTLHPRTHCLPPLFGARTLYAAPYSEALSVIEPLALRVVETIDLDGARGEAGDPLRNFVYDHSRAMLFYTLADAPCAYAFSAGVGRRIALSGEFGGAAPTLSFLPALGMVAVGGSGFSRVQFGARFGGTTGEAGDGAGSSSGVDGGMGRRSRSNSLSTVSSATSMFQVGVGGCRLPLGRKSHLGLMNCCSLPLPFNTRARSFCATWTGTEASWWGRAGGRTHSSSCGLRTTWWTPSAPPTRHPWRQTTLCVVTRAALPTWRFCL